MGRKKSIHSVKGGSQHLYAKQSRTAKGSQWKFPIWGKK